MEGRMQNAECRRCAQPRALAVPEGLAAGSYGFSNARCDWSGRRRTESWVAILFFHSLTAGPEELKPSRTKLIDIPQRFVLSIAQ